MSTKVMAVVLDNKKENSVKFQSVLSEYPCLINARIGLNELGNECARTGLIILHLKGEEDEISSFKEKLEEINEIGINIMDVVLPR